MNDSQAAATALSEAMHADPNVVALGEDNGRLGPALRWVSQRSRGSEKAAISRAVPSVEPSSTTMSSRSSKVWPRTLRIAAPTYASRLYAGINTETVGCGGVTSSNPEYRAARGPAQAKEDGSRPSRRW